MSMRTMLLAVVSLAILCSQPALAATGSGRKVALVIGNSNYRYSVELKNPKNDAALITETLRSAGFEVIGGADLDKNGMNAKIDEFTESAYDAEVALIYYAGHGLQVDGHNYLVPVDAQLEKAAQLQTRAISVDKLLQAMPPEPAVNVVILDACRDNPLARSLQKALPATRSSSMGAGLAPVQATSQNASSGGLLIAYATDPGAVALDGKDVHSPYTTALAKHLTTPGVELQSALTRVRADVATATGNSQRPWHNASLSREIFLGGTAPVVAAPVVEQDRGIAIISNTSAATAARTEVDWEVEQKLWDEVSKRDTAAHYELYLEQYPTGKFASLAKLNLDQLSRNQTEVAALPTAPAASQIPAPAPQEVTQLPMQQNASTPRTAVSIADEVKMTPGTPVTESALGLDKSGRIDLQLRLTALGHLQGMADGAIGAKSRSAIASWQRATGIFETAYLTAGQYDFLIMQTEPMMAQVRAQHEQAMAQKAAARRTYEKQRVVRDNGARRHNGDRLEGRVRNDNAGDVAGAAFMGGLLGGALGSALGR